MKGNRILWGGIGGGLVLLLVLVVIGLAGVPVMPSVLAAWLFVLSVPVGALLLVCGIEAMALEGSPASAWLAPLRSLLPVLPVAAVLGLPVLLLQASLYDPGAWPAAGVGRIWFARGAFSVRMVLLLLVWSGLALGFGRAGSRRVAAGAAFGLMLVTGSMAALDWIMAVEPGIASSSFGLLVLSGQAVSAIAVASLLAPAASRGGFATPMLVIVAVWAFLHFTQFLVVWSANEPAEAAWYLHRIGGLGGAAVWLGVLLFVAALGLPLLRGTAMVGLVAGFALLVRLVESFWLVTPAFRGGFVVSLADLLAVAGFVGLLVGLSRLPVGRLAMGLRHARH